MKRITITIEAEVTGEYYAAAHPIIAYVDTIKALKPPACLTGLTVKSGEPKNARKAGEGK